MDQNAAIKQAVGNAVAATVKNGQVLGLGTGSTAACAIAAIGQRIQKEGLQVKGVPSSFSAEQLARKHNIPLCSLNDANRLDLVFDGADEVSPKLDLIKGRGGAHTREKILASHTDRFVVLVDSSKLVKRLGTRAPVPIEVLPMAATPILQTLRDMGAHPLLRMGLHKDGPVVSDQGFWIIDARFGAINDPAGLDRALLSIPGVLDHGLFLGMATCVLVGEKSGEIRELTRKGGATAA